MHFNLVRYSMASIFAAGALFIGACAADDEFVEEGEAIASVGQALTLGSSLGAPVTSGYSCNVYNGIAPACNTYSNASDVSYMWTAPSTGQFNFWLTNADFDSVLVITDYVTPTNVLACKDANRSTAGESVTLSLVAGQRIIVVIDAHASLCGNFNLNISKNCATPCNTPPTCKTGGTCTINGTCTYSNTPAGTACNDTLSCTSSDVCDGQGTCKGIPYAGSAVCNGACVYTSNDACNCGACGNACSAPTPYCSNGLCKSTCFAAGTLVTMADGSTKPIESIKVDEWVLGYDTQRGEPVPARVTNTFVHPDTDGTLLINGTVRVTPEHPFYVDGAWVDAGGLRPGDELRRLIMSDSKPLPVVMEVNQIKEVPGSLTTYNIEVAGVHDYFADGYLVHNKEAVCTFSND